MSTYTETTSSIAVCVEPTPNIEESRPAEGIFTFVYTIRIENRSEHTVQLVERHWIIESADTQIGEVKGPGVVGVQPTLDPGDSFTYSSSAVIQDPVGSMRGSYIFSRKSSGFFVVQIPRFRLEFSSFVN